MDTLLKLVMEMRTLLVLLFLTIPWSEARNDKVQRPFDIGHGFHIRLAVPGNPGNDYPTLDNIPKTSFSCSGKEPGYYADTETNCQVFRVCTFGSTYGFQSFLCPNGTLFNQAVFVCDWWMNVKCENSKKMYNYKNELGNLKIGPHFMRDIKKMITHPMRNPYDKTFVKNNVIIMQEYKPPNGQFYNSVSENNSKQNSIKNIAETKGTPQNTFASTTPRTQYYSNFNIYPATSNIVDYFQQQKQRSSFQPNIVNRPAKLQNDFHNERTGQKSPTTSKNILSYTTNLHLLRPTQIYQKILQSEPYINSLYSQTNIQRDQLVNKKQLSTAEQLKLGAQYPKQQLNQHIAQDKELYSSISNQIRHSKDTNNQIETKTKKNLVSNDTSSTLIRKTLAYHKVIRDSKNGPKSRITFKTWIVRPRSGKLTADSTPYTYNNPAKYRIENIPSNTQSYTNNNSKNPIMPYEYNPPTVSSTQIITSFSPSLPTKASLLYLPPTTYNPLPIIYGPPTANIEHSRQYLLPGVINSPLTAAGSSPAPFFQTPFTEKSKQHSISLNKQSLTNTNHNNIAFSDILTKENLDIRVGDIVKDTNNLLKKASPNDIFEQDIQTIDYPDVSYLPQNVDNQRGEKVLLQPPPILPKNSRLIATPSFELEPPVKSFVYNNENINNLSYLSFIKKPVLPTIERTVSFKITIPEKIADYIFKKSNNNISDDLEILNTGNTNYFVLANKYSNIKESQYVPIGKLIWNNSSDISPSQDLVFSFLAESINAAKKYSNIATQNTAISTPTQLRNINSDDSGPIANQVSQLTSAQYSNNKISENTDIKNDNVRNQQLQGISQIVKPSQQITIKQLSTPVAHLQTSSEPIYSGQLYQLPVPLVTKQFYNSPPQTNAKYTYSNNRLANNIQNERYHIEKSKQIILPKFDIIESKTRSPNSLKPPTDQNQEQVDQGSYANSFLHKIYLPKDGITAQIHDKTIGTIPHPLNKDKLIKYKKNQIYYIHTHLNNNNNASDTQINNDIIYSNLLTQPNREQSNHVSYQLLPSVGYKIKDNKDNQNLLNTLQINEVDKSKQFLRNTYPNHREDISTDVDYIVNHPTTGNSLYNGPSSYYAPQASIGNLELLNTQTNFNANLEKFDTNENNGYPKVRPSKQFIF